MFYLNLPHFKLSPREHILRQCNHEESAKDLRSSIENYLNSSERRTGVIVDLPDEIPMASNPKWKNRTFGAVNTVEKSACVAFVSKVILDHFGYKISMLSLLHEIERKGYRVWKLEKRSEKLYLSYPDLERIQDYFPDDLDIQYCSNLADLYDIAGKPVGIGGSMFLIDNVINYISENDLKIANDTRIHSIDQLFKNIVNGYPVPLRVNNSIYHDDPKKTGGHYITLFGIVNNQAILVDSSLDQNSGIVNIPFDRLLKAMIVDENLICAWNLHHCK